MEPAKEIIVADASTRTVERALSLLGTVCDRGSVTLADAARGVDLSASTALRLLRTLEAAGFVRKDDDGYRPGMRIVQLGAQALSHESLVSLAAEPMKRLVQQTGESAYLNVPSRKMPTDDEAGIYIAIEEGTHSVRHTSWVGRSIPLEGTAAGQVLHGSTPEVGYVVVSNGVEPDVTAIAAPILMGPRVVAALSVVAPSYRISDDDAEAIGKLVAAEAATIMDHYAVPTA
ncbi:MAG TPA: IclR family transcriptional regulator [Arthrobacter sp.]|nr:IclR family transcriptional regulator [Arthrobacter sp.]